MRLRLGGAVTSNTDVRYYRFYGLEACCPNDIRRALEKCPQDEELVLEINSGGGSVYAGFEMYNIIRSSGRQVKAEIQSLAGSAMSVVICACNPVLISPVANLMIHRSACYSAGNAGVHRQRLQMLTAIDDTMLNAYCEKAGEKCSRTQFRHMIDNETFMTPQDAVNCGLADGLLQQDGEMQAEIDPAQIVASVTSGTPELATVPAVLMHQMANQLPSLEDLICAEEKEGLDIDCPEEPDGVQNTAPEGEGEAMEPKDIKTSEELATTFPELTAEIRAEAAKAERERISAIDSVALPGFEKIVSAAKADPAKNAGTVAMEIIAAQKQAGVSFMKDNQADAADSGVNAVQSEAAPEGQEEDPGAEAKATAEAFRKGVKNR